MNTFRRISDSFRSLSPGEQRWYIAGIFIVLQAFIWLVVFELLWYGDKTITDTPVYFEYASRIAQGMFPYHGFSSEYPPVAMLLFSLPRLLSGNDYGVFVFWFEIEMLLFSCGNIVLMTMLTWRLFGRNGRIALALTLYTVFVLSIGSIVKARFDIAVAFLILASLAAFITDRRIAAWMILGLGLMTKVVPVLIGPLFLITHLRLRQKRELWLGPSAMVAVALIVALPFLFIAASGLAESFLYHAERPLQIESSWASPLLLANSFGDYQVRIMNSYGSHNVFSSLSSTFTFLSGPLTVMLLIAGYWIYRRRGFNEEGEWSRVMLVQFAAVAIATFIVGGKVFSPQFLIWLLPLIPLVTSRQQPWPGIIYGLVLVLTQWEFPYRYWELYLLEPAMVLEVAVRNMMLAVLILVLLYFSRPRSVYARLK